MRKVLKVPRGHLRS